MAKEHRQPTYRAILVPDHRMMAANLDATDSSYTQAGPVPGVPDAQQDTEMVLESSGTQAAAGALRVRSTRAGFPGRQGARFAWKQDADTNWYGWEPPHSVTGWEYISGHTGVDVDVNHREPHAITLSDGQVLVIFSKWANVADELYAQTRRRSTDGTWGSAVTVYTQDGLGSSSYLNLGTLLELPSGRVLAFVVTYNETASTAQIRMLYSDDKGDTWTTGAKDVLPSTFDISAGNHTLRRIRAAYGNGQILFMVYSDDDAATVDDRLFQYASDDLGASFVLVDSQDGSATTVSDGYPDIVVVDGRFVVGRVKKSTQDPTVIILGNAYEPFSEATDITVSTDNAGELSASLFVDGDLALAASEDGTLYAYWRITNGTGDPLHGAVSYDGGETWSALGQDAAGTDKAIVEMAAGDNLVQICATYQRGRVLLIHGIVASTATTEEGLGCFYLGGYTDVEMPGIGVATTDHQRASMTCEWCPIEEPDDSGWTLSGAGTDTLSSSGYMDLAGVVNYSKSPTTADTEGLIADAVISVQVGYTQFRLIMDNGANSCVAEARLSTTTLYLWDRVADASVASVSVSSNTRYQLRLALQGTNATLWYRAFTTGSARQWTQVGTTSTLTTQAAVGDTVRWGNIEDATAESEWVYVAYSRAGWTGSGLWSGQTNPGDLIGRAYATVPVYVDGVKIAAVDGPTFTGDVWNVDTRYRFPIENVLTTSAPSPQRKWRTTSAASQVVSFTFDSIDSAYNGTDLFGVYYEGQASVVLVQGKQGTSWTSPITLATIQNRIAVTYTRSGSSVVLTGYGGVPAAGIADQWGWIGEDELVGMSFGYSTSSGGERKIARNTRGLLSPNAAVRPVLYLEDVAGGDSSSGTGYIQMPRCWAVVSLGDRKFSGLRFTLPVYEPGLPDGYMESGVLLAGPVYLLGWDPSQEQGVNYEHGTELAEAPDGSARARNRRPVRRERDIAWAEGVDIGPLMDLEDAVVYGSDSSTVAAAMRHDATLTIEGLYRYLNGPNLPVVYLPRVPHISGDTTGGVVNRAQGAIYGRIVDTLSRQTLMGSEEESEIYRVGFRLREEL